MQHEIGIILRVKNLQQTKKELAGVFGKQLTPDANKAAAATGKVNDKLKQTGRKSKQAAGGVKEFTSKIFSSVAILGLFNRALGGTIKLYEEAGQLERAGTAFESSVGKIATYLPQFRKATRGTVEDLKLLQSATIASSKGLGKDQLTKAFQIATLSARKMGKQVPEAIDLVTRAMTDNDLTALTSLGIQTKKAMAFQAEMELIKKMQGPAGKLTAIRRTEAFIMEELRKKYGDINDLQGDGLETLEQTRASYANLRRGMGDLVVMGLQPAISAFGAGFDATKRFIDYMKQNFPTLTKLVVTLSTVAAGAAGLFAAFKALKFIIGSLGLKKMLLTPLLALGPKGWAIAAAIAGVSWLITKFMDMKGAADVVGAAFRSFFSIIGTYDSKTGIGRSLESDQKILGSVFKWVQRLSRAWIVMREFGMGAWEGISEKLKPVLDILKMMTDVALKLTSALTGKIGSLFDKAFSFLDAPITQDTLGGVRSVGKRLTSPDVSMNGLTDGISAHGNALKTAINPFRQPNQDETPTGNMERTLDINGTVPLGDPAMTAVDEKQRQDESMKLLKSQVDTMKEMLEYQKDQGRKQELNYVMGRN